jgi:hypothetical protein
MLDAFRLDRPDPGPINAADKAVPETLMVVTFSLDTLRDWIFPEVIWAEAAFRLWTFAEVMKSVAKLEVDDTLSVVKKDPDETFRLTEFALVVKAPVAAVRLPKLAAPVNVDVPWTINCC